jgi:hypothetical protein
MPSTNFPQGISATTSVRTVAGEVFCATLTVTSAVSLTGGGTVIGSNGSIFGSRANIVADGSMTVTLSSAVYVTGALLAPYTGYPEIVYLQGATANITRSIRLVGGVDSTGTAAVTLTVGSATSAANGIYTTIGGTVITQGSQFVITSAVTATVNTGFLTVNFIAASA